jgi:hypothetical protein
VDVTAQWTYLVADLMTQKIVGELPLKGVALSKVLNGSGQIKASVKADRKLVAAVDLYDLTRPVRRCIYAVRDGTPWWGGIVWASVYDSDTQSIELAGADWWSYFDHRKVLPVLSAGPWATNYVAGLAKIYTQVEQNAIARDLVALAQSHTGGNIGVLPDVTTSGILRDRTYTGFDLVYAGQALRDLAGVINGPDIRFDVGAFDTNGRVPRLMLTGDPFLGQQGQRHVWDLGGNLQSYNWDSGGGVMATRAFAQGEGEDQGTLIAVAEQTDRYVAGWPLLETDDIFDGVTVTATLQEHAATLLDSLSLPLTTLTLQVRGDIPPLMTQYAPGDTGRAVIPAGDLFFRQGADLGIRVLSIEASIGDDGTEAVKVTTSVEQVMS